MSKIISIGVVLSLLVFMPACKGSTTPAPPAVTVTSITVTSASTMLKVGQTETFTATCNMSNGTQKAATGTWSSSAGTVAQVNASGLVTIVGAGNANIVMTESGKTGSKGIRGVPDYQGTWGVGTYRFDSCSNTGDWATMDFCGEVPVGTLAPITLTMTQTTDIVNCNVLLGQLTFTAASSTIATNGQLTLVGAITYSTTSINVTIVLQQATPGQLTGTLVQVWTDTTLLGYCQFNCSISSLSRTNPSPNEAAVMGSPLPKNATLQDIIRVIIRR